MKTFLRYSRYHVSTRFAIIGLCFLFGLGQVFSSGAIDELVATMKSERYEHGVKFAVSIKNTSQSRILIFGADYFFGRLTVKKSGEDPWKQFGRAQNDRRPALVVIEPGDQIDSEYFVRVARNGSKFDLEMLSGESMLSASVGPNETLVFQYEYSFLESATSPWSIGFMNTKKRSVIRGSIESNQIEATMPILLSSE